MSVLVLAITVSMIVVTMTPAMPAARSTMAGTSVSTDLSESASSKGSSTDLLRMPGKSSVPEYVPGEVIVKFKQGVTLSGKDGLATTGIPSIDELSKKFDVKGDEKLPSGSHKLKVHADADVQYVASLYEKNPNVEYAQPNFIYHTLATPNDPGYPQQWAHEVTQAPLAWDITTGNPSVVIAVIDTGVDWNHPDLAANIWTNADEIPGNGIDDDSNGYVDDVRGWDFADHYPDPLGNNNPMDDNGHGTHCAGIIAGIGNNMIGIAGVTWNCKIMAVKAADSGGSAKDSDTVPAIYYATNNSAKIISMSLGGPAMSPEAYEAIKYARSHGVLLVAAAGNEGSSIPSYPAYFSEVVAVSATDSADKLAWFSNYGSWVDVSAPGVSIYSTMLDDTYTTMSGTSMACPYVAGVAGLIWSRFPTMTNDQVRAQLQNTTDDIGDPGFDIYYGWGRVNARWAVDHTSPTRDLRLWGMDAPKVLKPGTAVSVKATVLNFGQTEERLVTVIFFVNGVLKGHSSIPVIPIMSSSTVSFSWTPTSEGWYDLMTVVSTKKPDPTGNDAVTSRVLVRTLETIYVPTDFRLQQALSYAGVGYTVRVAPGSYYEQLQVTKAVTMLGENWDTTILDGTLVLSPKIWLAAEGISISGFTIKNSWVGVWVEKKNVVVTHNKFLHDITGINVISEGARISDNTIVDCGTGIFIDANLCTATGNTVTPGGSYGPGIGIDINCFTFPGEPIIYDCIAENNELTGLSVGIRCYFAQHSTIRNNQIAGCYDGIEIFNAYGNTVHHNNLIGNTHQVTINQLPSPMWDDGSGEGNYWSDYTGTDTNGDGVGETNVPWHSVDNHPLMHPWGSITNTDTGLRYATLQKAVNASTTVNGQTIHVKAGTYCEQVRLIKGLTLQGEGTTILDGQGRTAIGIDVGSSTIRGFTLQNYDVGIYILDNANGNIINNNTLTDGGSGVFVLSSSGNLICDNGMYYNTDGIAMIQSGSGNNVFKRNTFSQNTHGMNLIRASGNTFVENLIEINTWGIYLTGPTSNNVFYHNNLAGNTESVHSATAGPNTWDSGYPSGGNYWSDYSGRDVDHDGIGDTPYIVDSYSRDNYPLMKPWDSRVHDVAVSTVVAAPVVVPSGNSVTVTVTVVNQGNYTETFGVTAYYSVTPIGTKTASNLAPNAQIVLSFVWNTTGVAPGVYTIKAVAAQVPGETDTADNTRTDGTVKVQPAPVKMHVESISFAVTWSGKTQKLLVTVKILDTAGNPVSSATVSGTLTLPGGTVKTYSGTTLAGGTVTFEYSVRNSALPKGTYTFTVTNVTHATIVYNPSENKETSDSYVVV